MGLALIVLAKAPEPGQAKTRLIPALGAVGAADLAARLLGRAVAAAACAGADRVEVCAAPDATHPVFARLAAQHGVAITEQGAGDLGARMQRALSRALRDHGRVLLFGTDAPALDAQRLAAAAGALDRADAVFVPALDGGYVLVGLRRDAPALFEGVEWSTPRVMAQTRANARRAGIGWIELDALPDIDEPADLVHLPPGWRA